MRDDLTIPPYKGGSTKAFTEASVKASTEGSVKASTKSPATEASASGQGSSKMFNRPLTALEKLLANVKSPVYLGARPGDGELTTKFSCKDAFTLFRGNRVLVCPNTKDGHKPNGSVHDLPPESDNDVDFGGNITLVVGGERIGFERSKDDGDWRSRIPRPIYPSGKGGETIAWKEMDVIELVRADSDSESNGDTE